jgi:hypothetical protein
MVAGTSQVQEIAMDSGRSWKRIRAPMKKATEPPAIRRPKVWGERLGDEEHHRQSQ